MEIIQLKDNKRFIPCNYHINNDIMIHSYLDMETGALIPQNLKDDYTFWHNELEEKNEYITFEKNKIPFELTEYCDENDNLGSIAQFIDGHLTYETMKCIKVTPNGILDGLSTEDRYVPCVVGVLFERIINDVLNYNGLGEVTNSYMEVSKHMPNDGEFVIPLHDKCDLKDVTWTTIKQIIQNLRNLYNDYDVDEEAMLYVATLTGKTRDGVPLTDVLEDCNEYKHELESLEKDCRDKMQSIQTNVRNGKYMDDFKTIYQESIKETIEKTKKNKPVFRLTPIGKYKIDSFLQGYTEKRNLLSPSEKSPYEGYVTKDRILYDLNQQALSNTTFAAKYPISEKEYYENKLVLNVGSDFYSMNNPIQEMACKALDVYVQTVTKDEHINADVYNEETYLKSLKMNIGLLESLKQNLNQFYDGTNLVWEEILQKSKGYIEGGEFIENFNSTSKHTEYDKLCNKTSEVRVKSAIRRELDKIYQNYVQDLNSIYSKKNDAKQKISNITKSMQHTNIDKKYMKDVMGTCVTHREKNTLQK